MNTEEVLEERGLNLEINTLARVDIAGYAQLISRKLNDD